MTARKRIFIISLIVVLFIISIVIWKIFLRNSENNDAVVFQKAFRKIYINPPKKYEALPEKINLLALGLDCRKGVKRGRTDAIHLITYYPEKKKVVILSFGRDMLANQLPLTDRLKKLEDSSQILAHIYPIYGREVLIELIESASKQKIDYFAEVGFSQVIGFCDFIGLDGVDVLKHLRHRKTLKGGSYQRGLNQGEFIKWLIEKQLTKAVQNPKSYAMTLYTFTNTNCPPEMALCMLDYLKSHPITSISVRFYGYEGLAFKDFDPDKSVEETDRKIENLRNTWDESEEEIFNKSDPDLANYLYPKLIKAQESIRRGNIKSALTLLERPYEQQLYWQIPKKEGREIFHIWLVRLYARCCYEMNYKTELESALGSLKNFYNKDFTPWQNDEKTPRVYLRKKAKILNEKEEEETEELVDEPETTRIPSNKQK
ncbi:MAG: LCP family protein [Candidatus Coatesbacteria bacterium]|nr:LCP family protein [Candidatus Coatesbacteria bacterium]